MGPLGIRSASIKHALQVLAEDNVATLLEDAAVETVQIVGLADRRSLVLRQSIPMGHKVAVGRIAAGAPVVKYGVQIGLATSDIEPGEWVHLHNCRSAVDERSNSFDAATGAATDTVYE